MKIEPYSTLISRSIVVSLRYYLRASLLVMFTPTVFAQSPAITWKSLGDDLEVVQATLKTGVFSNSSLTAARTSLSRYKLAVLRASEVGARRTTARTLCKARHGAVCINANFFDEQGRPLGLVISRGVMFQKVHRGGDTLTAVLAASRSEVQIVQRDTFNPTSITEAVQAGPRLLKNGQAVQGIHEPLFATDLSGVCVDSSKRLIVYQVSSALFGTSLSELQALLRETEFNCHDALNFDGGGSSQMYIGTTIPGAPKNHSEIDISGDDEIPVAIALIAKQP